MENRPKSCQDALRQESNHPWTSIFHYSYKTDEIDMKLSRYLISAGLALLLAASVSHAKASQDKLQAVGSFTIVSDIVQEIGGKQVEVHNIIPTGHDPHEWSPSPQDTKKTADADAVFYFGWNLEGLEGDDAKYNWVKKLLKSVDKDPDTVFTVSDHIQKKEIGIVEENKGTVNPHAFVSPKAGIHMARNVRDALIKVDPEHKRVYEKNAEAYLKKLKSLDKAYQKQIDQLPRANRILFTGERAFQYLAEDYGLKEGFIWEIDGNDEGTPSQIKRAIKFVNAHEPPALFYEYNDDKRPMDTVSKATDVPVSGTLYSDDMGKADSYVDYLKHNLKTIIKGLSPKG